MVTDNLISRRSLTPLYGPASNEYVVIPAPGVLANDFDPEGGVLTVDRAIDSNNGITVRFNANGDGSFQVRGATAGHTATFTYRVSDGMNTVTGTITIIVR